MFHIAHFSSPHILEFELRALNWQQESEESVILFCDIGTEHEMNWPGALIIQRQTTPRIFLVSLHRRLKSPIFDQQHISNVFGLLAEAQICGSIIQSDIIL